ncbi:MAG TPA: hypothetical protein VGI92_09600 [Gemmatimonadales bacterium]|jgi:hypothetical protein
MKDLLEHLTPDDDGRAFTEAVLLRASGALHRRRAAQTAQRPALEWLAQWARPWVVAALVLVAAATMIPSHPWSRDAGEDAAMPATNQAMIASLLPADMAMAAETEAAPER